MTTNQIMENYKRFVVPTYNRFPVVMVKGQGCLVWDLEGKKYLDLVAGVAVNSLGHAHPCVVEAISKQAPELIHTSNLYYTIPQLELAKRLSQISFGGKAFFANSGAEANEAAIKLARRFGKTTGGRHEIITMNNSFHGRTMATLTATGQKKIQKDFDPLVPGFKYVEFNNISAVKEAINKNTCAILVEPIQGEGGVNIPANDYLQGLRTLCDEHNLLLMLDEVQTGIARTGRMFAYQHYGIIPDVMTLAKGLGGGLPIGAMLVSAKKADLLPSGSHASTFGATPLVCSAAIAVVDYIIEHNICALVEQMGEYFVAKLQGLSQKYPTAISGIRGKGLMIGMALKINGATVVNECLTNGLLINSTAGDVLRFVPPLIITREEIDESVEILDRVLLLCQS
ncbi:aspartate aminotransferase family protein [Candidatus Desantisbacteria bacterium CG2_30_40_21]|uniref:Acetylornithine aminotransferase n=5 Tax=unclassified Candidatus Desantisiibacteriota TaxID=3106372 RepID=A0A2M7JAT0_9BACT|nr:MAG: aspartate aminotransferase family protein [Candidatus Desantisbacteria bacterium CG2_30_40_21]PIP41515.1 MAG: aspartate aminotransferase family protein [Candidatus Desantisbacteria bacterium CG23_combo_of_CG06-09_8_20_14_all_40_23]PIX16509.1 MAG: aspartate aminotransferase family protein [Candidatus Desantisbacteria bacterium CG_4_8_14_3_um_filter_40_12]PIY20067.1 MAG: aspartate aminotransferase family protein [Candidatus Desantisbacteria bacterium CG_4_10_14_3_um_filter_40_18]PJB28857.